MMLAAWATPPPAVDAYVDLASAQTKGKRNQCMRGGFLAPSRRAWKVNISSAISDVVSPQRKLKHLPHAKSTCTNPGSAVRISTTCK
jgi:hypothetical protein